MSKNRAVRTVAGLALACFLALVLASAAAPSPPRSASARTIATAPHFVAALAQDGRYIAWAPTEPTTKQGCEKEIVVVQDLRTGRRMQMPTHPACNGPPWGLVLAGRRAYWMRTTSLSTEGEIDRVVSSSLSDLKPRLLGGEETKPQSYVLPQPPVSDGKRAYFWSGSESGGRIIRMQGLQRKTFSPLVPPPAALAASEGRFARVNLPLQRDEASSPAWSPDGKAIAYVRHDPSQIWQVTADGSDPHQIAARGNAPDWSPDGTKLAYNRGDSVVVANADGSDPQIVTSGGDPAWSPDGRALAVDGGGIWIVSADGQNRRRVIANGSAPDWSPDGSRIVYDAGSNDNRVTVVNADGTGARFLGVTDDSGPEWSPDGSEIAYSGDSSVCVIRPDGTHKHCLPIVGGNDGGNVFTYDPSWGPVPGQLVFSYEDDSTDGDSHLVIWPGNRQITMASPQTIGVSKDTGRTVAQINPGGPPLALAVSSRVVAALIHDPSVGWEVKIYQPRPRTVPLPSRPHALLSAAGTTLVFQIARTIETLDALHGSPHAVATIRGRTAVGLSIFGRRIAWADRKRIRILDLPR